MVAERIDGMQKPKTHREQVIEECQRIEVLARMLVNAANRHFGVSVGDEDFETGEGPESSNAFRTLRSRMERTAQCIQGLSDSQFDQDLFAYTVELLRDPNATGPIVRQLRN